jgi:hypothetical protein
MSSENKFFDEWTETLYVSASSLITRLRSRIDPDTELHVTSKATRQGGSFRAVWVNVRDHEGFYDTGMELLDVEGNMWGKTLEKQGGVQDAAIPEASLECQRCRTVLTTPVPEALDEFINEGFTIARHCDKCKGSTRWTFSIAAEETVRVRQTGGPDDRRKGRAAIKMKIKVYCDRLGSIGEDTCETINVSANGLYFTTQNPYIVGEMLRIVAPYQEGAVAIPVPARVVRLDRHADSPLTAVAVEMKRGERPQERDHGAHPA